MKVQIWVLYREYPFRGEIGDIIIDAKSYPFQWNEKFDAYAYKAESAEDADKLLTSNHKIQPFGMFVPGLAVTIEDDKKAPAKKEEPAPAAVTPSQEVNPASAPAESKPTDPEVKPKAKAKGKAKGSKGQ